MAPTASCDIIYVEDDLQHQSVAAALLASKYGHQVISYRDLYSLRTEDSDDNNSLLQKLRKGSPLVVALDLMLAKRLNPGLPYAPRWPRDKTPTGDELDFYADDELGLKIGEDIRAEKFLSIPSSVPIVFMTARNNEIVTERIAAIAALGPAVQICKPAFVDDLQAAIVSVLARRESPT